MASRTGRDNVNDEEVVTAAKEENIC